MLKSFELQFSKFPFLSFQFKFRFNFLWVVAKSIQIPHRDLKRSQFWILFQSDWFYTASGSCVHRFYRSARNLKNAQGSHHQRYLVFLGTFLEVNYIFTNITLYSVLFSEFICEIKFSSYFYMDWNSLHYTIILWYHWFQAYPPFNGK